VETQKKSDDPIAAYISLFMKKVDNRFAISCTCLSLRNLWSKLIVPDGFVFGCGMKPRATTVL